MIARAIAVLSAVAALATPLAAQEVADTDVSATGPVRLTQPVSIDDIDPTKRFVLRYDVRLGGQVAPAYFGSDEYVTSPDFALNFDYAKLRGFGEYGSVDPNARPNALGIRGSVRYIGRRNSDDYDDLKGLDDVDPSLELGLGVIYRQRNFDAYADARYGIGHNSFAGEFGMNGIFFPTDKWELRLGPRMNWGGNGFAETYFGVTDDESAKSGYDAYDAGGGILGAGFEASARYRFNELWGVEAAVRGDRLLNSAADSPITEAGSEDQFRLRLGITRELILQF